MPPQMMMPSAVSIRLSISLILSEILAPPTIAMSGFCGLLSTLEKAWRRRAKQRKEKKRVARKKSKRKRRKRVKEAEKRHRHDVDNQERRVSAGGRDLEKVG